MQYFGFDRPSFGIKTFGFGSSEFSPLDLFAGGKQGVWYDPSDKSTLFQDVARTVPVTKDGDPVGLMLDKSKGLGLGGELIINGFFTDGLSSWGVSGVTAVDGVAVFSGSGFLYQAVLTADKTYVVSFDIVEYVSGSVTAWAGGMQSEQTNPHFSSVGKHSLTISVSAGANGNLVVGAETGFANLKIGNISVREIKGNHALQSISAARPLSKTDTNKSWLYNDKVDDKMLVTLTAMTATVIKATDEGVSITYPVSIAAGDMVITSMSTLGRDYGHMIINKELSVSEKAQVTEYFNAKRGV